MVSVLLITFNRPSHTQRTLEAIVNAHPGNLYVFQDGPRDNVPTDFIKCKQVRRVIEKITTNTGIRTIKNYSTINLGCGPGPATAISWFFDNEEKGIIIEDDAVPHPDFFKYAEELLNMYEENKDIQAIGSMHIDNKTYGDGSYYFSKMNRTLCAWATWRRAWQDFDLHLESTTRKDLDDALKFYGAKLREREYWCDRLEEIHNNCYHNSSWDQQFWMSIWLHHGKGIMPNVNLSSNIGFDEEGTHTTNPNSPASRRNTGGIFPLIHPSNSSIQQRADQRFQKIYFEPYEYGLSGIKRLPYRINKRLKRLFHHKGPWIKTIQE